MLINRKKTYLPIPLLSLTAGRQHSDQENRFQLKMHGALAQYSVQMQQIQHFWGIYTPQHMAGLTDSTLTFGGIYTSMHGPSRISTNLSEIEVLMFSR